MRMADEADDAKDQISWKLVKGDVYGLPALGDPTATSAYSLCIYDESASTPTLVGVVRLDPGSRWLDKETKGFRYKDKSSAGIERGITKATLKPGADGKAIVKFSIRGAKAPMPVPYSVTKIFDQDAAVTVQLVNEETSACWTSAFTSATANDGTRFEARSP